MGPRKHGHVVPASKRRSKTGRSQPRIQTIPYFDEDWRKGARSSIPSSAEEDADGAAFILSVCSRIAGSCHTPPWTAVVAPSYPDAATNQHEEEAKFVQKSPRAPLPSTSLLDLDWDDVPTPPRTPEPPVARQPAARARVSTKDAKPTRTIVRVPEDADSEPPSDHQQRSPVPQRRSGFRVRPILPAVDSVPRNLVHATSRDHRDEPVDDPMRDVDVTHDGSSNRISSLFPGIRMDSDAVCPPGSLEKTSQSTVPAWVPRHVEPQAQAPRRSPRRLLFAALIVLTLVIVSLVIASRMGLVRADAIRTGKEQTSIAVKQVLRNALRKLPSSPPSSAPHPAGPGASAGASAPTLPLVTTLRPGQAGTKQGALP